MSMPVMISEFDLTDFHVEKQVETCYSPAVSYYIYDKVNYGMDPETAPCCGSIHVPGLKIDEFSIVLIRLDSLLYNKILPEYGQSVTERFFEEFIEQFYPKKKYQFIVKFYNNACIIDNAQNDGESSADNLLLDRGCGITRERWEQIEQKALKNLKSGKRWNLREYLDSLK